MKSKQGFKPEEPTLSYQHGLSASVFQVYIRAYWICIVFLKGMAHILEGLYLNVGERMISDIDFLVAQDQVETVAEILKEEGYARSYKNGIRLKSRHYARLIHKDFIGAVEIHWNVLNKSALLIIVNF